MRFRLSSTLALATVTVGVATAAAAPTASATTTPPDSSAAGEPPVFDLRAPFWADATAKCTDVLNRHLDRQSAAFDVFVEVLEADVADAPPSADTIAGWTEALNSEVARADAIRAELAELAVDDPLYADLWDIVVSAADDGIDVQRTRLAALETGDWEQIVEGINSTLGQTGTSTDAFAAIDASPLRGTDCAVVHSWRLPDDESVSPEFVREVTGVCANVANRRRAAGFDADFEISLNFLGTVYDAEPTDEVDVPDELGPALDRIVAEWELTVADVAAIDPSLAPSPEAWAEITAVPAERLTMFEQRRDAAASGDTAAIIESYDRSNFGEHPGWDWELVGIDHRICSALQN